jgi:hypothetical protein
MQLELSGSNVGEPKDDRELERFIRSMDAEGQAEPFAILTDGNDFIQAAKVRKNVYTVEYRDWSEERHYRLPDASLQATIELFQAYFHRDLSFRTSVPWKDVTAEFEWPAAPKLSLAVPGEEQPELTDDRPVVYMDRERVFINMDNERLAGYLEKLGGKLASDFLERQSLLDKRQGEQHITDAMYLDEVMNASGICGSVLPLLYVLMDNLMLWLRGDDGRLFQLTSLRCTDGLIILGVGDDYLSVDDACMKRTSMPSQTRMKKGDRLR